MEEATIMFPKEADIAGYGEPEEMAELMAFLVSPAARWMKGTTLRMDGEVKPVKRLSATILFYRRDNSSR